MAGPTTAVNGTNGVNGVHGHAGANGEVTNIPQTNRKLAGKENHEEVLAAFRCLIADLCQQFGGGHPGGAMSMAAIGISLWCYTMKYSPRNPSWFNRDRFVLSNGHCCLFQYTFLHFTGYKDMTWDQLKSYHSALTDSIAPGHPEVEHEGVEVTTGPLGQGIANAVGMAMATKHLGAVYNRPGFDVVDNMTYCTVGDACLQEGVGLEAISLAGHWRLKNLVVLYDNNQITCDGSVDICNTENINQKMTACNWDVVNVEDGCYDITGIVNALDWARNKTEDKPTFINCRTIIGIGSQKQGQASTHGAAFGVEDVKHIKKTFKMNPDEHFVVPDTMRNFFKNLPDRGVQLEKDWTDLVDRYSQAHPEVAAEFKKRMAGEIIGDWRSMLPTKDQLKPDALPGRKSAGLMCNPLAQHSPTFMVGTADLSPSVAMLWPNCVDFQHPDLKTTTGPNGDYTGRYIHYGIREHAMASIANGLSAYNIGTIIPVTSSFFMFYIYAAPGLRMGALQQLPMIHIATHDSIGTGEDGPTHQPIALASFYRALPNFLYFRPCDSEETAGAFETALEHKRSPTMVSCSRQANPQFPQYSSRQGAKKGGYVFVENDKAEVTLIGAGAEMKFAVETKESLEKNFGIQARIVSMPCMRVFDRQDRSYKRQVFKDWKLPVVAIEAYSMVGWERYADAGFGMTNSFGRSLPGADAYKYFGFKGDHIAPRVKGLVDQVQKEGMESLRGEFIELNTEWYEHGFRDGFDKTS